MAKPMFSYTSNFLLTLDVSRPAFKAQALFAADAVAADTALPANVQAQAGVVRAAALAFNDKLVSSLEANAVENFGDVRAEADKVLRTTLKLVGLRYDPKSDAYDAFLPRGLKESNKADESTYEALFDRFNKAIKAEARPFVNPEAAPGDLPIADQVKNMFERLQAATKSDTQYESKQEKLRTDITADWRAVAIAEWCLWLDLSRHFAADPNYRDRVYGYFDFSQVHVGTQAAATDPTPAPQA